ncbi:hypothetical protein WJX77_003840 [Trebouxia sp. C0004]
MMSRVYLASACLRGKPVSQRAGAALKGLQQLCIWAAQPSEGSKVDSQTTTPDVQSTHQPTSRQGVRKSDVIIPAVHDEQHNMKPAWPDKQQATEAVSFRSAKYMNHYIREQWQLAAQSVRHSSPDKVMEAYYGCLDQICRSSEKQLDSIHISAAVYGTAKVWIAAKTRHSGWCGKQQADQKLRSFIVRMLQRLEPLLPAVSARQAANLLWSSAQLRLNPDALVPVLQSQDNKAQPVILRLFSPDYITNIPGRLTGRTVFKTHLLAKQGRLVDVPQEMTSDIITRHHCRVNWQAGPKSHCVTTCPLCLRDAQSSSELRGSDLGEKKVSVSRCARTTQGMLEVADYLEPSLTAVACGSLEADSDRPESYGAISQQTGESSPPLYYETDRQAVSSSAITWHGQLVLLHPGVGQACSSWQGMCKRMCSELNSTSSPTLNDRMPALTAAMLGTAKAAPLKYAPLSKRRSSLAMFASSVNQGSLA